MKTKNKRRESYKMTGLREGRGRSVRVTEQTEESIGKNPGTKQ